MKNRKLLAMLMALAFTAGMLTACGETKDMETSEPAVEETEEAVEDAPEEEDAEETAEESEPETAETTEAAERKHISDYMPGTWDGVIYANEELGVKLTFPESYTIFSGDALKEMMGQTIDVITENSDIKNVNEQALAYDFLAIAPDQVGNVILTVEENVQGLTAEEYVDTLIATYEPLGVPYQIIQEADTMTVGETEFYQIGLMLDYSAMTGVEGASSMQAYVVHADEDFLYYFIVTLSDESADELGAVMDGMEAL